ncbi:MAG: type II toxin-antitoxin system PrlF family antitoxin [Candidatus Omnitrophota bacterium]
MKTLDKGRYYMSHITSKGQTTIPRVVRAMLGLKEGSEIAFKPASGGFMMVRVATTVKEDNPYTPQEWKKIEKLVSAKGKTFHNADAAIKHLHKVS